MSDLIDRRALIGARERPLLQAHRELPELIDDQSSYKTIDIQADGRNITNVTTFIKAVDATFGQSDVFVSNAGLTRARSRCDRTERT